MVTTPLNFPKTQTTQSLCPENPENSGKLWKAPENLKVPEFSWLFGFSGVFRIVFHGLRGFRDQEGVAAQLGCPFLVF